MKYSKTTLRLKNFRMNIIAITLIYLTRSLIFTTKMSFKEKFNTADWMKNKKLRINQQLCLNQNYSHLFQPKILLKAKITSYYRQMKLKIKNKMVKAQVHKTPPKLLNYQLRDLQACKTHFSRANLALF
ncbi:transmembrane protein, putative (macronuclear) [Tetrahymena thermophila SB210]|uniref:Transmembrane protein, putative n=1 Tax=Tetrahymena thermophila (strain SB210) TaxID=312017 RepID=W7XIY6_TETTS|nr:transmembrane protein, putative [Tetrahymena thermophila SB210]EWS73709.1 transmembrane protein, putative [Tetrahymena thermophila SB210]|eukprot:XP_012653747.1 transmembrane protein, putative [Tetrahymena thermophila SB210]